ncbi:hypothetical protein E2C01_099783 [Portunus trituberculatus]|uniref:Uncharacterized protein n=1 Tax=Portunus trituberculatus TaxID=210409 RepID=A0A5B7K177_PORTR|nr:hypothetical protein [Portunus trituberculatus]
MQSARKSTHSTSTPFTTDTTTTITDTTTTTTTTTTSALQKVRVTSQLRFSPSLTTTSEAVDEKYRLDEEMDWNITCARLQVDQAGVLHMDYNPCSSVVEDTGGRLECTCEGEGLFGFLQVSTSFVRVDKVRKKGGEVMRWWEG